MRVIVNDEAVEVDTHLHVHKENNVLFEAVAAL